MADITQNFALSDIQLVAINKSSEGMNVPIYHINGITREFLEAHYNDVLYLNFGKHGDDTLYLAGGYVKECLNYLTSFRNNPVEGMSFKELKSFSDGNILQLRNDYNKYSPDGGYYTSFLNVVSKIGTNGPEFVLAEFVDPPGDNEDSHMDCRTSYDRSVILRYEDSGVFKYVPIGLYMHIIPAAEAPERADYAIQAQIALSVSMNPNSESNDILKYIGLGDMTQTNIFDFTGDDVKGTIEEGPEPPPNPYEPGGPSEEGVLPPGTFDDSSDPIPDSSLPTLSAANTGFTRIYNPTLAQVQDLARYLWTDETVIQTIWNHIKQYFEDPMQAIIGFNLVPCAVPNAGSQNFALMYIDTGVSMNVAANQFVDVDCGTVKLERYYGSALDQSPYTRVSCFLPFIGTVRLNTDEVMGTTLSVKYRIDICSGSCVAKILVDGNVIYQYSGHCAINIPFSSADFSSYVSSAISVARLAIGAGVAGSAGTAAASVADPEQQTNKTVTVNRTTTTTARNPSTGRQITTGTRTVSETRSYPVKQKEPQDTTQASFNALSPENISNTAGQIMASKPSIEHSGSFSGNTGYLGVRRPYLLIERPNMCMPQQYQHFNGFPAMITMELGTCRGFTRIHQVQLTGMSATNPEQAEILSLLKSGVYF